MRFAHRISIDAPRATVWALVMDLPAAAGCVPGARDYAAEGDGVRGVLDVRVGPIKLALAGRLVVETRDDAGGTARLRADAADAALGGAVRSVVELAVEGDRPTVLQIQSDVTILGRIGELGQPLIARQAEKILAGFAANLARAASAG